MSRRNTAVIFGQKHPYLQEHRSRSKILKALQVHSRILTPYNGFLFKLFYWFFSELTDFFLGTRDHLGDARVTINNYLLFNNATFLTVLCCHFYIMRSWARKSSKPKQRITYTYAQVGTQPVCKCLIRYRNRR